MEESISVDILLTEMIVTCEPHYRRCRRRRIGHVVGRRCHCRRIGHVVGGGRRRGRRIVHDLRAHLTERERESGERWRKGMRCGAKCSVASSQTIENNLFLVSGVAEAPVGRPR